MYLHKILLLLPLVGLISCASHPIGAKPSGQNFKTGTIRIGGDLGYSSNGNGTMNGEAIHFDVNAGYFVTDIIELGAAINVEDVNRTGGEADLEALNFALYGRAYSSAVGPFRTFAELAYGLGTVKAGASEADSQVLMGSIGMMEFITEDVAVELSLEQSFYFLPAPAIDGNGLAINLGVSMYF